MGTYRRDWMVKMKTLSIRPSDLCSDWVLGSITKTWEGRETETVLWSCLMVISPPKKGKD